MNAQERYERLKGTADRLGDISICVGNNGNYRPSVLLEVGVRAGEYLTVDNKAEIQALAYAMTQALEKHKGRLENVIREAVQQAVEDAKRAAIAEAQAFIARTGETLGLGPPPPREDVDTDPDGQG